ncbi:MAG: FCD domain-containing protein [Acetobacteraceae bacterium]
MLDGTTNVDELEIAQELLEREIAYRAAIVGTETNFDELARLCDQMAGAATVEKRLGADYRSHMRLAQVARNPVTTLIAEGLSSVLHAALARRRWTVRSLRAAAKLYHLRIRTSLCETISSTASTHRRRSRPATSPGVLLHGK